MFIRLLPVLAAALLILTPAAVQAAESAIPACPSPRQKIDTEGFITFGGIEQWVTIRGDDCANPIILMVHGGPGNPLTPFSRNLYGAWEKDFTIVQWDQRGAGMTFGRNRPSEDTPMTVAQLRDDGIELTAYLTRHMGQRKVILMGGSWGSVLAVEMVKARPDLFHAYLGASQMVTFNDNLTAAYERTRVLARTANDGDSLARLEALGPPPWTNPRNVGILRRVVRKYETARIDPAPQTWWTPAPAYTTSQPQADYEGGEEYSFLNFVGLKGDGMGAGIDLPALGTQFDVPVFIVQGEEDLWTQADLARAYFDSIKAPEKAFIVVPRTGHDPNPAMVAEQFRLLTERIRPLAVKAP